MVAASIQSALLSSAVMPHLSSSYRTLCPSSNKWCVYVPPPLPLTQPPDIYEALAPSTTTLCSRAKPYSYTCMIACMCVEHPQRQRRSAVKLMQLVSELFPGCRVIHA